MNDEYVRTTECFCCGKPVKILERNYSGSYDPRWMTMKIYDGGMERVPTVKIGQKEYSWFSWEIICGKCASKPYTKTVRDKVLRYNIREMERKMPSEKNLRDEEIMLERRKTERAKKLREVNKLWKMVGGKSEIRMSGR